MELLGIILFGSTAIGIVGYLVNWGIGILCLPDEDEEFE